VKVSATLPRPADRRHWRSYLFGLLLVAGVVAAVLHRSEAGEFIRLAQQAEPWWILLAFALQALTYPADGEVWRGVVRAGNHILTRAQAYDLALARLAVGQTVPSAGISGNVFAAAALEQRRVPRPIIMAGVVVSTASLHLAFVLGLAAAVFIATAQRHLTGPVLAVAVLFATYACILTVVLVRNAGRPAPRPRPWLARIPPLRIAIDSVAQADPQLARSPTLLARATALQLGIMLLDAATMWALLISLGGAPSPSGVFASFLISSVFRTIAIVPGGLGAFEAASVLTLGMAGVTLPLGLSATLLFRGLSFWLPMLPGFWASRRVLVTTAREPDPLAAFWSLSAADLTQRLGSSAEGLSSAEAAERLRRGGPNRLRRLRGVSRLGVLLDQLRSPLLLLLVFAAAASALTREWLDALIVLAIVAATVGVGFSREYSARAAAEALYSRLRTRTRVLRDGRSAELPVEEVVPGDIVLLAAGDLVPADALILDSADLYVSEAVLTGESFPAEKRPDTVPVAAPLARRANCVFLGTNVRSGTARCLVVHTGAGTQYGAIARRLTLRPPETEFDRGVRRFGYLLTSAMLILVLLVFAVHVIRGRAPIETLLFAIALAVGLSPELLPAILSVNLARGAQLMARHGVLVRRLNAIENLGSMDILCTDKTGTLTEGVVRLEGAYGWSGEPSAGVLELGARNAALETGLGSPLDDAILEARRPEPSVRKLAEIPFDFIRKRVSVVLEGVEGVQLVTKGAFQQVLEICTTLGDEAPLDDAKRCELVRQYERWSERGIRVLAVAERRMEAQPSYSRRDERDAAFAGFLTFVDQPKEGVAEALADLAALGVGVKLITGDSRLVARHVAEVVGIRNAQVLTGGELDELHDEALWHAAERTDLFVEVDPNQKERIILALKKTGHVVGFLGDGVNDAPAMHAADTSLSVEQAVDVAREAADFVLLERDLDVIRRGIVEGRKTFANTLKYVLTTTSANLGNMLSMAAASLFLPFLPLLAGQILLNNFLSDVPAVGLADDHVDPELVERPRRWNMRFIGSFMTQFGILSSAFDLLTFGVLLGAFRAGPALFRTGWFVESLLTELVIALVVRTRRPFFRSRPGNVLLASTIAIVVLAVALPYLPRVGLIGFVPLPGALLLALAGITVLYVAATEMLKIRFYARLAA
jgi:Mg2+-importing ATPase